MNFEGIKYLVVLDKETFYSAEYSLRKMSTEAYIRDERFKCHGAGIKINGGPSRWIHGDKLPYLYSKMPWDEIALIGHNLHFDGSILNWRYGYKPALYIDTLGMSRALLGQHLQRHGLTYVAEALLGAGKTEGLAQTMGVRDLSDFQEKILADYCINDVEKTWGIFKAMAPHFPQQEYRVMDWVTRQFTQPRLYLDTYKLENYLEELILEKDRVLKEAGLESRDLLMSNNQYAEALEQLNVIPPTKINAKGKVTFAFAKTDTEHTALLEHEDSRVQALVAARLEHKSTIEQTRAIKYHDASTRGEWPVDYNYAGAKNTHRLSGANGGGGNPTNLKRGGTLRQCIYAAEGKKLLVADLKQIEARLVLWLGMQMPRANSERIALDLLREGDRIDAAIIKLKKLGRFDEAKKLDDAAYRWDLYCTFGTEMYGYQVYKKTTERQVAKSGVLGLGFGMGVPRFMDYCRTMGIRIEPVLAEAAVNLYRHTYSGVKQYWMVLDKAMKSAVYDGPNDIHYPVGLKKLPVSEIVYEPLFGHVAIKSPSGLLLKYPDLSWDAEGEGTYRDGNSRVKIFGGKFVENEVQHLARNILMGMLVQIDPVYPVVMSTYDELVMEIDEDAEEEATEFVTRIMTTTPKEFPGLPLGVETGCATTYGEAK